MQSNTLEQSYVSKDQRKKILLMCDDIRFFSGIATMGREMVISTAQHYNWVQIAGSTTHPDFGKIFDISDDVNKQTGLTDSNVKIYPVNGYGDPNIVRQVLEIEKPDAVLLFTDPRYWVWFFQMEHEVRTKIPITYLSIWDCEPEPLYNAPYYMSVDLHMGISRQTVNLTKKIFNWAEHDYDELVLNK